MRRFTAVFATIGIFLVWSVLEFLAGSWMLNVVESGEAPFSITTGTFIMALNYLVLILSIIFTYIIIRWAIKRAIWYHDHPESPTTEVR